ncbi:histidine phosphatase family protein [Thioclava sp. GXIMD4215]|uniref:histidine phosphatase family protein n=1 Tax=Thioclava sp. GXIMD4215 TaxID=3131928 RepID=UPI003244034C
MSITPASEATELVLIRHAPVIGDGCVYGRRDLAACLPAPEQLARVALTVGAVDRIVASPALRCQQTAKALWPTEPITLNADLWEQDLGAWEGRAYAELPDLGPLPLKDLAAHRPPDGESFLDLGQRVIRAIDTLAASPGRIAVVAHAGSIRAVLGWATGALQGGLRFGIDPLSLSHVTVLRPEGAVITAVNRCV